MVEWNALKKLHRNERDAADLVHVDDGDNVVAANLCSGSGFPEEPTFARRVSSTKFLYSAERQSECAIIDDATNDQA